MTGASAASSGRPDLGLEARTHRPLEEARPIPEAADRGFHLCALCELDLEPDELGVVWRGRCDRICVRQPQVVVSSIRQDRLEQCVRVGQGCLL